MISVESEVKVIKTLSVNTEVAEERKNGNSESI